MNEFLTILAATIVTGIACGLYYRNREKKLMAAFDEATLKLVTELGEKTEEARAAKEEAKQAKDETERKQNELDSNAVSKELMKGYMQANETVNEIVLGMRGRLATSDNAPFGRWTNWDPKFSKIVLWLMFEADPEDFRPRGLGGEGKREGKGDRLGFRGTYGGPVVPPVKRVEENDESGYTGF